MILLALAAAALPPAPLTIITGARVFDGSGRAARVREVAFENERIIAVARRVPRPDGATIVDARGQTLIPGLHDLHIHTRRSGFASAEALTRAYAPYLAAGVTTINEYSVAGPWLARIRGFVANGAVVPHLNLAIRLGVPHGHGTEFAETGEITTQVDTAEQAQAEMPPLIALAPDVFKVFADGWRYGDPARPDRPSIDLPTLTAITTASHAAGIEVVTHTVTLGGARLAAAAGVDAVVHGIGDARIDAATIRLMKARDIAYVSTLVVYEPQSERILLPVELAMLSPDDRAREGEPRRFVPQPIATWDQRRWDILRDNVRRLHRAGVRIGIGTDAGITGVYHGWATLREIRLLTTLGFSPAQALRAATSVSADIMRAGDDHGRIAPGQRADLVLIAGKPDKRIDDLYAVQSVWVAGRLVPSPTPLGVK